MVFSVGLAIVTPNPAIKLGAATGGLLSIAASKPIRKIAIDLSRKLDDTEDISHTAWQQNFMKSLLKENAVYELPPQDLGQAQLEPAIELPVEDLAQRMAETTLDPSNGGSVLIACPKRTGKSNLLRAAISATSRMHGGNVEFLVFDGKGGESFCGLEGTENYHYSGDVDVIPQAYERLVSLKPRLKDFQGFPTVPVLDEYNNTRAAAKLYDKLNGKRDKTKYADLLSASTYERITKGGSKLVCDWITSHEPDVEAIDLSLSLQQSLNYIVLGRGNLMGAIYAAVAGRRPIVDDDLIRERLKKQFEQWRQQNGTDPSKVIALTNIGGDWRLVILPRYPDTQQPIQCLFNGVEQSAGYLEESTSEEYDPDLADWELLQQCGGSLKQFALAKGKNYTGGAVSNRVQELRRKFG